MDSSHDDGRGSCRPRRSRCGDRCRARRCRALWLAVLAGSQSGRTRWRSRDVELAVGLDVLEGVEMSSSL
eukprot:203453-Pyramimonas_sp.AAC.1